MFIVVFDDDQGLCVPYGKDPLCEGALESITNKEAAVVFETRQAARKSIRISKLNAQLKREQGKVYCDDFTECASCIKIIPLKPA